MNLFFKHGKKISSLSNILLKDFHVPAVGAIEINQEVEPAIWFKTLIIDSIYVDCDVRNIFWREKSACSSESSNELDLESTRLVPRMTRAVYDEGDCCEDFELFDAVIKLLVKFENKSFSEKERAQEILRILHLYVLPEIVLKVGDVALLREALDDVELRLSRLSDDIQRKDRGIYLTETSLRNQRDKLFISEDFESESHLSSCNVDFLREILCDLERDIESFNYELEAKQTEVDKLRNAVTDEGKQNLHKIRMERDRLVDVIEMNQRVRESIKNVTVRNGRPKRRKKVKPNVFHEIYLELKGRLGNEKRLVKLCCDQKLKITSVREAISEVCEELLHNGESCGFVRSLESVGLSTDVLGPQTTIKPSNWQTVEDKVKSVLYDSPSGPSDAFRSFCDSIKTKISAFLIENELFTKSKDREETRVKGQDDSDEFVNISYLESITLQHEEKGESIDFDSRISSGYRPFTHAIKDDILKHIEDQSNWLLRSIEVESYKEKGKVVNIELPHKIWMCYESHLYNQIFKPLSDLYYMSYVDVARRLYDFVSRQELHDLEIDEPWLNDDYTPTDTERLHNSGKHEFAKKAASIKSGLSITLGRMTLDELYQSAKKDCEDISSFVDCPFDTDDADSDASSEGDRLSPLNTDIRVNGVVNSSLSDVEIGIVEEFPKVKDILHPACLELENCIQTAPVIEKMKHLTKTYKLVNKTVAKLKKRRRHSSIDSMVCCDEILSASIVLLTLINGDQFVQLYAHLNLMIDLMPSFLTGSLHDCSLTNFYSAFQFLIDKQTVSVNRVSR